jgi:hypothetical protein
MQATRLDVSDLPAPEPFQKILGALEALPAGHYLSVYHRKEPLMIYPTLEKMGYRFHVQPSMQKGFDIYIWNSALPSPKGLVFPNLAEKAIVGGDCR